MTTTVTEANISYSGNGSSTTFAIPFDFNGDSEIVAYLITNSTNDVTTWTNPTNYSISGTDLIAVTAPASGTTLVIRLNVSTSQSTDYVENSAFSAASHEAALDKLTRMVKELKAIVDYQCVKFPINRLSSTTFTDTTIAANKYFKLNSGGSGIELDDGTTQSVTTADFNDLNDVTITGAASGDLIKYDGSAWVNTTLTAYSTPLSALHSTTVVANKIPYYNGSGTATTTDFTSFARSLLDDSSASAARSTLGVGGIATQDASNVAITGGSITGITDLAIADGGSGASTAAQARINYGLQIGSDIQAYDAGLQSIAGLTTAADKMIYTTASDVYATTDLSAFGRSLIDDAAASNARTTLGVVIGTDVQAYNAGLASIAGLTTAADKMIYTTASNTYAVTDLTSTARSLLDDTSVSAMRTTLGLAIGTDVQAYDADLTTLSTAFTSASSSGPASLKFHEDTDNGTNYIEFKGPSSIASNQTWQFSVAPTIGSTNGRFISAFDSLATNPAVNLKLGDNEYVAFKSSSGATTSELYLEDVNTNNDNINSTLVIDWTVNAVTDGISLTMQFGTAGPTYVTSNYNWTRVSGDGTSVTTQTATSQSAFDLLGGLTLGNTGSEHAAGRLVIRKSAAGSTMTSNVCFLNTSGTLINASVSGYCSGFDISNTRYAKIISSSGNITVRMAAIRYSSYFTA